MYVDTHVHLRDFGQKDKETVAHGLEVARDSGIVALFEMPNTNPPIITRDLVLDRIKLARDAKVSEVTYGMFMGLTKDPEQIKRAVECYREFREVVGFKLFAGESVGDLEIIEFDDQRIVYETLVSEGYEGVIPVHCEKESEMHRHSWTPSNPITHCHARPVKAEVESVRDQIQLVNETGFKGKLHIAHISAPEAVDLVNQAKKNGMDISSGICPHHFIYDWQQMKVDDGVRWKMNPPLRSPESRERMFQYLRDGKIDWIETDHAPHTLDEKVSAPFMSGIPGIPWWPIFEEYLRRHEFSNEEIEKLTFSNAVERFDIDLPARKPRKLKDRRIDYPWDPYKSMANEIGWKG